MSEKEQEGGRRRGRGREIWEELHMHTMHAHTQAHTHTHCKATGRRVSDPKQVPNKCELSR